MYWNWKSHLSLILRPQLYFLLLYSYKLYTNNISHNSITRVEVEEPQPVSDRMVLCEPLRVPQCCVFGLGTRGRLSLWWLQAGAVGLMERKLKVVTMNNWGSNKNAEVHFLPQTGVSFRCEINGEWKEGSRVNSLQNRFLLLVFIFPILYGFKPINRELLSLVLRK